MTSARAGVRARDVVFANVRDIIRDGRIELELLRIRREIIFAVPSYVKLVWCNGFDRTRNELSPMVRCCFVIALASFNSAENDVVDAGVFKECNANEVNREERREGAISRMQSREEDRQSSRLKSTRKRQGIVRVQGQQGRPIGDSREFKSFTPHFLVGRERHASAAIRGYLTRD